MDIESLTERREVISRSFDEQTRIRNEAESEQVRLQGEYRLIQELINKLETPEGDVK